MLLDVPSVNRAMSLLFDNTLLESHGPGHEPPLHRTFLDGVFALIKGNTRPETQEQGSVSEYYKTGRRTVPGDDAGGMTRSMQKNSQTQKKRATERKERREERQQDRLETKKSGYTAHMHTSKFQFTITRPAL